jgi:hypothetical protein
MSVRHVESLPTVDGGSLQWEFADPGRLLSQLVQEVPQVQRIFAEVGFCEAMHSHKNWRNNAKANFLV